MTSSASSHPDPLTRISWAYQQDLPGPAKAVLVCLAFRDGETCNPSIRTISKDTGYTRNAVKSAIRLLVNACLIETLPRYSNNARLSDVYVMDYTGMRTGAAPLSPYAHGYGGMQVVDHDVTQGGSGTDPEVGPEMATEHEEEHEEERGSDTEVSDTSSTTGLRLVDSAVGASAPPLGEFLEEGDLRSPSVTVGASSQGWEEIHQLPIQDEEERLPDPWAQVLGGSDSLKAWGYR